ncbi:MAG: hypothetical protein WCK86_23545 [Planctomycetia bacterium]
MKQHPDTSGTVGRRDLAMVLATGHHSTVNAVVTLLGLERQDPEDETPTSTTGEHTEPTPTVPLASPTLLDSSSYPARIDDIALWRCVSHLKRAPLPKLPVGDARHEWHVEEDAKPASHRLLAGWNQIAGRIRAVLSDGRCGKHPDVPKLVRQVATGQLIVNLPRQKTRHWGAGMYVIRDEST